MFLSVENIATLTSQKFISREAFAKNYPVYPKHGDVLMTRIGDIGTSNVVETDDKLAFYVSLALLKPFDVDSYYLDKSLQSPSAKEELYRRTLHIAFPKKINKNQIAEVMLPIPRSRQEQEQIGALFRDLDSLITLHQRKYDKLCVLKKSMLDKMFPKGGSLYPEIRFAGFTDPWEQRKLGDVANVCSGRDYKHLAEGPIPVYGTGGYMTSVSKALSYDEDAIGIGRKGTIDKPYRLQAPFWTVDTLFYAIPEASSDINFLLCSFLNVDWKSKDESTGLPSLSKRAINETEVLVPDNGEQRRIGGFFDRLDTLITLHQRKLELLRNIKKSMLDKMFV